MGIIERSYTTYRVKSREDYQKVRDVTAHWLAVGKRLGFPRDQFYTFHAGGPGIFTVVGDRRWDSLTAYVESRQKLQGPEVDAIWDEQLPLVENMRLELLNEWDPEQEDQ